MVFGSGTWRDITRGAVAGLAGTVTMTVPILAAHRARLIAEPPPREISASVAAQTPLLPAAGQPGFPAVWLGAHLLYGAACGVAFTAARRVLPASPLPAGLLFGGAVWAASYLGLVPALGLYPWPGQDDATRLAVMVLAHAVFGVTVAWSWRSIASR